VVPYLPHLVLLVVALVLVLRTPETRIRDAGAGQARQVGLAEMRGPRLRSVLLPLAPWVFGSASTALAHLPSLVEH
jgi:hypothetical protein